MGEGLAGILLGLGGKTLARIIGKKFGEDMGALTTEALESLAASFGAENSEPETIEKRITEVRAESEQNARSAVAYAELDFAPKLLAEAEVWKAANEQQRMTNELLQALTKEGGLAGDWLWIWQYVLMAFWAWAIIISHVVNALIRLMGGTSVLPAPDLTILMTLTGAYLALHMGGHTVLELMRGGAFERKDKA